ncbi:MAG: nucleotidyltransferase domain-containing protein [Devosia sp.]
MQHTPPPGDIPGAMRRTICAKLEALQDTEGLRILFAVESGSRAWGFPSPDSDYDVRFVYARPVDWYLSITPGRDVVELPLEGDLDINGWDVRKALSLILKPNPVLLEWLSSPIRYIWDEAVCARLIAFSNTIAHNRACLHHYIGLGENTFRARFGDRKEVSLKKYFLPPAPCPCVAVGAHAPRCDAAHEFPRLDGGCGPAGEPHRSNQCSA